MMTWCYWLHLYICE